MKKRKILMAVLALVLFVSAAMLLRSAADYKKGEEIYAEAQQLVELPELSRRPRQPPHRRNRSRCISIPMPTPYGPWTSPPCGR